MLLYIATSLRFHPSWLHFANTRTRLAGNPHPASGSDALVDRSTSHWVRFHSHTLRCGEVGHTQLRFAVPSCRAARPPFPCKEKRSFSVTHRSELCGVGSSVNRVAPASVARQPHYLTTRFPHGRSTVPRFPSVSRRTTPSTAGYAEHVPGPCYVGPLNADDSWKTLRLDNQAHHPRLL